MANDWDDDDDDSLDGGSQRRGNDDSSALRSLRKSEKEKGAALKAAQDELVSLRAAVRDRTVKDVIAEKGLNPKIAAFIPKDLDNDGVLRFIEENADVFGNPAPAAASPETLEGYPPVDQTVQALSRISEASTAAQPYANTPEQMVARIAAATSPEELNQLIFGNKLGPSAY